MQPRKWPNLGNEDDFKGLIACRELYLTALYIDNCLCHYGIRKHLRNDFTRMLKSCLTHPLYPNNVDHRRKDAMFL